MPPRNERRPTVLGAFSTLDPDALDAQLATACIYNALFVALRLRAMRALRRTFLHNARITHATHRARNATNNKTFAKNFEQRGECS